MNISADRQRESTQGDGYRDMRRCYQRRVTQAKVLVTYMNRESDGGDDEAQSIPGHPHRIGRRPTTKSSESDAEDKVPGTKEYRGSQPT